MQYLPMMHKLYNTSEDPRVVMRTIPNICVHARVAFSNLKFYLGGSLFGLLFEPFNCKGILNVHMVPLSSPRLFKKGRQSLHKSTFIPGLKFKAVKQTRSVLIRARCRTLQSTLPLHSVSDTTHSDLLTGAVAVISGWIFSCQNHCPSICPSSCLLW